MSTYADVMCELRHDDLKHDPWGTSMAWHFAVADCLTAYGISVPESWDYRPSIMLRSGENPEPGSYPHDTVWDLLTSEGDVFGLIRVGDVLSRYENALSKAGRSY